jgi:DNA-binding transcriptional ArsR family regulator
VIKELMDKEIEALARKRAQIYRIFGNTRRVMILWAVAHHEMSVSEIADCVGTSLQNTSQHLRLMKDKGILSSRRDGHTVYYQIADNELVNRSTLLLEAPRIQVGGADQSKHIPQTERSKS